MTIQPGRLAAAHSGPIVVFLIGARVNRLLRLAAWLPVLRAMPRMLQELYADPDSGFIGGELLRHGLRTVLVAQYWRSFDQLETYARAPDREHWPAWRAFNKAARGNAGAVGIFHETYCVGGGAFESIYVDMPPFGLGRFTGLVPATGSRDEARARMANSAAAKGEKEPADPPQPVVAASFRT